MISNVFGGYVATRGHLGATALVERPAAVDGSWVTAVVVGTSGLAAPARSRDGRPAVRISPVTALRTTGGVCPQAALAGVALKQQFDNSMFDPGPAPWSPPV